MLAFYNLEMPELLTVSDMDRKHYFTVRAIKLPAMSASREQLAEANKLRKAHMAPAKVIFNSIKHEVISTITRDNEQGDEAKEFARFQNEETEKFKKERTAQERTTRRIRRDPVAAGVPSAIIESHPARAQMAIDMRKRAQELEKQEVEADE